MYLDEVAQDWLALIESLYQQHAESVAKLAKLATSAKRSTSEKGKARVLALTATERDAEAALKQQLALETEKFFSTTFGIRSGDVVTLKTAAGKPSATVVAMNLTARRLVDGTGLFSVSGDSMATDLTNGLPSHELLMAREAKDERLVAIT